jgi:inorganic triphosphatase YgiF
VRDKKNEASKAQGTVTYFRYPKLGRSKDCFPLVKIVTLSGNVGRLSTSKAKRRAALIAGDTSSAPDRDNNNFAVRTRAEAMVALLIYELSQQTFLPF